MLKTSKIHYLLDPDTCQSLHSLMEMSLSKLILILPLWALLSKVICEEQEKSKKHIYYFYFFLIFFLSTIFKAKVLLCIH